MIDFLPLDDFGDDVVDALLDRAFGTDRKGRTAYRVREGTRPIARLSIAASVGEALVGCIQCWPIALHDDVGAQHPLVMLGPVAVEPPLQGTGIGRALLAKTLGRIGEAPTMLIGDPEYYGRFGFDAGRTRFWRLPGPFEARRVLAIGDGVPDLPGVLGPRT